MTLELGDDIPVPTTTFQAIAAGGVAANPLTSFNYRTIGVNIEMTPRVTYEGEIVLELTVENSTLGADRDLGGGVVAPQFGLRRVSTVLRLRDGESSMWVAEPAGRLAPGTRPPRVTGVPRHPAIADLEAPVR